MITDYLQRLHLHRTASLGPPQRSNNGLPSKIPQTDPVWVYSSKDIAVVGVSLHHANAQKPLTNRESNDRSYFSPLNHPSPPVVSSPKGMFNKGNDNYVHSCTGDSSSSNAVEGGPSSSSRLRKAGGASSAISSSVSSPSPSASPKLDI